MSISRVRVTELLSEIFKVYYARTWAMARFFNGEPHVISDLKDFYQRIQNPILRAKDDLDEVELYELCKIILADSLQVSFDEGSPPNGPLNKEKYIFCLPEIRILSVELKPPAFFCCLMNLYQQDIYNLDYFYIVYRNRDHFISNDFSLNFQEFFIIFGKIIALLKENKIITGTIFQSILRLTHEELEALHIFLFELDEKKNVTKDSFQKSFDFICQKKNIWLGKKQEHNYIKVIFFLHRTEIVTDSIFVWVQALDSLQLGCLLKILKALYQKDILNKIFFPFLFNLNCHEDKYGIALELVAEVVVSQEVRFSFQKVFCDLVMKMAPEDQKEHFEIYKDLKKIAETYMEVGRMLAFNNTTIFYSKRKCIFDINQLFLKLSNMGLLTIPMFKAILAQPALIYIVDDFLSRFRWKKNIEETNFAIRVIFFKITFELFSNREVKSLLTRNYHNILSMIDRMDNQNTDLVKKAAKVLLENPLLFKEILDTNNIKSWHRQYNKIEAIFRKLAAFVESAELAKIFAEQRQKKASYFSLLTSDLLAEVAAHASQCYSPEAVKIAKSSFSPSTEKPATELHVQYVCRA